MADLEFLKKMSERSFFALGVFLVVVLGYADFVTSWQIKFTVLYLIPISITWYVGSRRGIILAVISGIAAASTEYLWGISYDNPLIPYWNISSRLCVFIIYSLLISKIKDQVTGLEKTVTERTNDLVNVVLENKQLESEHQDTYCTLHATLESMNEGFVSLDRQWRYTYVNKAAAHLMGRDVAELLGHVCWEVFPWSVQSLAYREMHRSLEENRDVFFEDVATEPFNHWYENRCYPSAKGVSIFFTDITERKGAESKYRALSEHLETVREQERLAISREIHDEIGQTLTAFKLDLSWIEHKFQSGNSELIGRFNAMRSSLDLLIAKAQNIASELRPPLLDNLGLAAAIDWQTREFKRRCNIECHLMLNEDIKALDNQTGTAIMRILQEALTNIARHARATEVSISLCNSGTDDLVLEISDNGCGISLEEIDSPLAFGVMGMQERARLCHGKLTIKGDPGEGTTIRLEIRRGIIKEVI